MSIRYIVVLERRITFNCVEIESTLEVTVSTMPHTITGEPATECDASQCVREYCESKYSGWTVIDLVREDHICG